MRGCKNCKKLNTTDCEWGCIGAGYTGWEPLAQTQAAGLVEPEPSKLPPMDPWFADTLGTKYDSGKPPITLLDRNFLEGAAQVMRYGSTIYGLHNWAAGISHRRLADAAMRHIIAWASGEDTDPESGLPHIDHASASLNMLRGNQRLHPELDDRYRKDVGK